MNHLETLNEYIDTHFNGNKTEREARIAFRDYRDGVLSSIPDMDGEFIREQPACVAVGFLGKLDFTEANPNRETLTVLRKNGLVRVADSALDAWRHLVTTDEEAACTVLELCISTRKHRHVAAIKATKSPSPQSSATSK
jgi:hypothetical protein